MLKRRLDLLIATMVITVGGVSTVYAQPWVPGIPGITQNPNAAGNVGINISPTPPVPGVGVAWDPLEISFPGMGLPPALRLSGTSTPPGPPFIMPMDYAQLGYALGAFQFSTLATTNDLVLATQGSSEDVIITANGKNTGQIRFATHTTGGVETERMTILDNTGNVGIGTTTPSEQLEVSGNVEFSGTLMPGGFAGASGQILQSNGAIMPPSWINPSAAGGAWIYGGNNPGTAQTLGTTTPVDLPFITSNATRMTIGAGGNVGIGTAPSVYRLEVSGDVHVSTDLDIAGLLRINGSSGTAGYVLMSNGLSSPGWVDAGVQFAGTFWKVNGQTIGSAGTYDLGPTGAGENLRIIADTGTPMYFPSTGNIGINAPTPGALLDVNGLVRCVKLTVTSDSRWKQNVEPVQHALDKLLALRGVTYTFRTDEYPNMNLPTDQQLGLIAQEVEAVVPEVVETDQFGYKSIAYQNLVPLLIQGVKEQQGQIDELRTQIVDLQARLVSAGKGVAADGPAVADAEKIELGQNVPNPFEEFTTIPYRIPASVTNAELVLYEAGSGREVERFLLTQRGTSEVKVGVAGLAAGAYVYRIIADGRLTGTKTMIVAR